MAATKAVKVGLFGGADGRPRNIARAEPPKSLTNIEIWSSRDGKGTGAVINGIRFTYIDIYGTQVTVPTDGVWGTESGGKYHQIKINTGAQEYVKKIEGSVGKAPDDGDLAISSLKVTTNTTEYDAYGDPTNGVPFNVPLDEAGIVAFYARSNVYLNAVGFYVLPLN